MSRKNREAYPLTAAQRLLVYAWERCPKPQLLNIGTSIAVGGDVIAFDALKHALHTAYGRCECLRLRFRKNEDGTMDLFTDKFQFHCTMENREPVYAEIRFLDKGKKQE